MPLQSTRASIILTVVGLFVLFEIISTSAKHSPSDIMLNFELSNDIYIDISIRSGQIKASVTTPSIISCGVRCSNDKKCIAFYYSPISRQDESAGDVLVETYNFIEVGGGGGGGGGGGESATNTQTDSETAMQPGNASPPSTTTSPATAATTVTAAPEKNSSPNCILFNQRIKLVPGTDSATVGAGNSNGGVLGTLKEVEFLSQENQPPNFRSAEMKYVTRIDAGLAAVYKCKGGNKMMTSIGWYYNDINDKWPQFETQFEACSHTICEKFTGGSATVLRMYSAKDPDIVRFTVDCGGGASENQLSLEVSCLPSGAWLMEGDNSLQVSCVSKDCYRTETETNTGHYGGDLARSISGEYCSTWYTVPLMMENVHPYDIDVYNLIDHCRDLDRKTGVPWCYVTDGGGDFRKEVCDVPVCVWDPLADVSLYEK